MTEQEYRNYPAVSYSSFSKWVVSTDLALQPFEDTEQTLFGKFFEDYLQNMLTKGMHGVSGHEITPAVYTDIIKTGKPKTKGKNVNVSEKILEGENIYPQDWLDKADQLYENYLLSEITKGEYEGIEFTEITDNCEWQMPLVGEYDGGIPIKAKYDIYNNNIPMIADLKTAGQMSRFKWQFRDKYFIQDYIYSKIAQDRREVFDRPLKLVFLVANTNPPYDWQAFYREDWFNYYQMQTLVEIPEYWDWYKAGRMPKGFRETVLL